MPPRHCSKYHNSNDDDRPARVVEDYFLDIKRGNARQALPAIRRTRVFITRPRKQAVGFEIEIDSLYALKYYRIYLDRNRFFSSAFYGKYIFFFS